MCCIYNFGRQSWTLRVPSYGSFLWVPWQILLVSIIETNPCQQTVLKNQNYKIGYLRQLSIFGSSLRITSHRKTLRNAWFLNAVITNYYISSCYTNAYNLLIKTHAVHKEKVVDTSGKKTFPILILIYSIFFFSIIIILRQLSACKLQMRRSSTLTFSPKTS